MLDIECFTYLNRALESTLAPIVIFATNRGAQPRAAAGKQREAPLFTAARCEQVRSLGPSELGRGVGGEIEPRYARGLSEAGTKYRRGLSGEIDMRIHWAHVEQLPPLKARPREMMAR